MAGQSVNESTVCFDIFLWRIIDMTTAALLDAVDAGYTDQ